MGFLEFLMLCVIVCVFAALACWALTLIPGVPAFVPRLIWIVAAFILVITLARAMGLLGWDPPIPHVR